MRGSHNRRYGVKTTDGKTVKVILDAKTKITQGKNKVESGAAKVGDRVVAEGTEDKDRVTPSTVQPGTPAAASKK